MKLEEVTLRGTRSAQPLATVVGTGTLYFVTDELVLERSNGSAWQSYSGSGGASSSSVSNSGRLIALDGEDGIDGINIRGPQGTTSSGGGSGNVTSTGAVGSEPGTPASGDLYLPNNGFGIERYSGSAWIPWGPIFPFTAPIDANYAWVNQGGASVDTTNGGIYLSGPAATLNWRIRKKAAPSTPYVITIAFLVDPLWDSDIQWGLLFRESSSGKIHTFTVQRAAISSTTAALLLNSLTYSLPTNFNAAYKQSAYAAQLLVWLRIADDGANRICSYSGDGQHWAAWHTVGRTDYLTANEVGFAIAANNSAPTGMTLLHWKET